MAQIHYETATGTSVIDREEYHTDQDPLLYAYDRADDEGVIGKIAIPIERVVMVVE